MKKYLILMLLFFTITLFSADIVEKIIIKGNKKVSRETIFFYLKTKINNEFSEGLLKKDFKTLWDTGFFADLKIGYEDGENGKIVIITVKENPLISKVTYKTSSKFKQEDIIDKLQENNIILMPYSYYNPYKLVKVKQVIKDMLIEKGYSQGKVDIIEKEDKDNIELIIRVIKGPKTRVASIDFPGLNKKLISTGFLRRAFKNNKPHGLISYVTSKDIFKPDKIKEDLEELKLRLHQKGFLEAKIGKPYFKTVKKTTVLGSIQKMMRIFVPIQLGNRYKVGEIKFEGNTVIKTKVLRKFLKLKKGKVFNAKKVKDSLQEIQKIYGSLGYFYCQIVPKENLDPDKRIADLKINIIENDKVYLGKLEFSGNTYTKDYVIRREWFLKEGKILRLNALEDSIRRMKQLGLVTIEKMPDIKADPDDPKKINLNVEVKELNRQMINFNVGYSGYDGWFIGLGYSTQNFLGAGETLTLNLMSGTRAKTYRFAFTEPYVFDLPASFGIDIFKTSFRYPYLYTKNSEGFNVMTSGRFWKYWGASFIYSYQYIDISDINEDLQYDPYYSYYYYYFTEGKRAISSISPTLYYSTVDSPLFPTSGVKYLLNYRMSGGFLGGDINVHKIKFEFVNFKPLWSNHILGMHFVYQALKDFGEEPLPFYEKYYLGGERSIRGFDIYRIGPRSDDGYVIGGNKAFFINLEYQIPLNEQFSFVFFYDIGNAYDFGEPISLKNTYSSMGVEFKIFIPMLNVPFRLIFAYNPRVIEEDDSNFVFRFAVGPSFY